MQARSYEYRVVEVSGQMPQKERKVVKEITREYDDFRPWWEGEIMQCSTCGTTVQLEREDEKLLGLYITSIGVAWQCMKCHDIVWNPRKLEK